MMTANGNCNAILPSMNQALSRPTLGVVIRFKNSAATLPGVLDALRRQSIQPDLIVGVDNQSTDGSRALMNGAGAKVVDWTQPYHHPSVLNFAISQCPTDLVLVLSSHTVLESRDAVERLVAAVSESDAACASAKWDADPFYTDAIDWHELKAKGLKFGSIYSNSMGIIRRSLWEQLPFDESLATMEDAAWAVEQVKRGHLCRRLKIDFRYQRSTTDRAFVFAAVTFKIARRHGLRVAWLGPLASLKGLVFGLLAFTVGRGGPAAKQAMLLHRERLRAWLIGRWQRQPAE